MPEPIPVVLRPQRSIDELDFQEISRDFSQNIGVTSVLVARANRARTALFIVNDSTATIWIALGRDAVVNQGIRLNANGGALEINKQNLWRGDISIIAAAAAAPVTVTEVESRYAY